MNPQNQFVLVQYWADYHLVASGNQYCLIDNKPNQSIFKFVAQTVIEAKDKCCQFLRYGGAA